MTGPGSDPGAWYAEQFLSRVPRVLTLLDRDPTSPTHGCLDRNHWHYRTQDFPSGMYQELALPLAQAFSLDLPGSRWRGEPALRAAAIAAVRFAARSAHGDGSCDDYFPNERALGATAFAASACAEALRLLGDSPEDLVRFLARRARWLLETGESGRLSNHQALAALAGARAAGLARDPDLLEAARRRLAVCLSWQHPEGWFPEYEGADPGYQTLTISFLSALRGHFPSPGLEASLSKGVAFAAHFLHPDGSFGGEYGSRNTCQVLPSGFERLASALPEARFLADGWLRGAAAGVAGNPDDDRIFSHLLADLSPAFLARRARGDGGPRPWVPPAGRTSFPGAGLHVVREGRVSLFFSTAKGGVFRAFEGNRLLRSDAGLVAVGEDGSRYATHVVDPGIEASFGEGEVVVRGRFHRAGRAIPTPMKQVAFRVANATVGRAAPGLVRRLLQRALITGKRPVALAFERRLSWAGGRLAVRDRVEAAPGAPRLAALYAATDATSIYVATSNLWQDASRQPWEDLSAALPALRQAGACEAARSYP